MLPAAIYRHKLRQDLHLSVPYRQYSWLLAMSLQTAKWERLAVRASGGANTLYAMFRRRARTANGLMPTAELCSAEQLLISSRDKKFDISHKV